MQKPAVSRRLTRPATSRIRTWLKDDKGNPVKKRGSASTMGSRQWVREHDTGLKIALDNPAIWEQSGRSLEIDYELGFSLSGLRAVMTAPESVNAA